MQADTSGVASMPRSKRFEGKTTFITGAASGIGRATAIAFAAEGASLVLTDRSGPGCRKRPSR
jgi:NAD(P)-dependent dehydrogenase (short-subunit alcohol dehydrogenase family)